MQALGRACKHGGSRMQARWVAHASTVGRACKHTRSRAHASTGSRMQALGRARMQALGRACKHWVAHASTVGRTRMQELWVAHSVTRAPADRRPASRTARSRGNAPGIPTSYASRTLLSPERLRSCVTHDNGARRLNIHEGALRVSTLPKHCRAKSLSGAAQAAAGRVHASHAPLAYARGPSANNVAGDERRRGVAVELHAALRAREQVWQRHKNTSLRGGSHRAERAGGA